MAVTRDRFREGCALFPVCVSQGYTIPCDVCPYPEAAAAAAAAAVPL